MRLATAPVGIPVRRRAPRDVIEGLMSGHDVRGPWFGDADREAIARLRVGPDRKIRHANEAAAALIGLSPEQLCSMPDLALQPPGAGLGVEPIASLFGRLARPVRGETTIRHADGRLLPVRFELELDDVGGYAVAMVACGQPIPSGPHVQASEALAAWRAAERRLAGATPGSVDQRLATADVRIYRAAYHDAVDIVLAGMGGEAAD